MLKAPKLDLNVNVVIWHDVKHGIYLDIHQWYLTPIVYDTTLPGILNVTICSVLQM